MPNRSLRTRTRAVTGACAALIAAVLVPAGFAAAVPGAAPPKPRASGAPSAGYRVDDYADGQALSILPPGENGLVTKADFLKFAQTGARPADSQDQLQKYASLLYGYGTLTDSGLSRYFDDESFGVRPSHVVRTEQPEAGVTIYRDTHDVPHVYGNTTQTMAFGAGYAQAEDRLFLMDVLRHYGSGTLASFLGSSCNFEQMDHDQLLQAPYTAAQATAQVNALPAEYGAQGAEARSLVQNYVAGVNAYVSATTTDPTKLPVDYVGAVGPPRPWSVADVVAVAGLIGGIFGKGGGVETRNAQLLQYLQHTLGTANGTKAFRDLRHADDPLAPTTSSKRFPYEQRGTVDPSTTALPDYGAAITGGPVDTTRGCTGAAGSATAIIQSLRAMPRHMSNALVVTAKHSAGGHPIAVFGPQVSYYAPQILSQLDLHSPDYAAEGASFPGTGLVELGRGEDYAWSATSAGTDIVDQRLELICNPSGGAPTPHGTYYSYDGQCLPMTHEHFDELAYSSPGATGTPTTLAHSIYLTRHGVVQGWTTAHGRPVAVVNQRSTFGHDVDAVVGFLGFGQPGRTHDVRSWMRSAGQIPFTFNWFYVDDAHAGYYVSGLDPIRAAGVDPDLPSWGTGNAEWQGFLPYAAHVHQIDPGGGLLVSWNNKPAPGFAAADDQWSYGQVYRSILLKRQLRAAFAAHHGVLTRAEVVRAMESAASQDLDGVSVVPLLLRYVRGRHEPAGVQSMLRQLKTWSGAGAHRRKASAAAKQYQRAAAVAIADEVIPRLSRAFLDRILQAGGANAGAYRLMPMPFEDVPNGGGAHLGSAFDGGFESYLVTIFEQLLGQRPQDGFGAEITGKECAGGPRTCHVSVDHALLAAYRALVAVNKTSAVSRWTVSSAAAAADETMPVHDDIRFAVLGILGQPDLDWQNRPTFQQVVQFPRHRPS